MINPATLDGAPGSTASTATLPPEISRTPQGRANASKFSIAGDKIHLATADMPERHREAIRWAAGFCRSANLSHHELAERLKKPDGKAYSADSVYHMFTGGRDVDQLDNMIAALERLRGVEGERQEQVRVGFLETSLATRIFRHCRRAFLRQKMLCIFGDSQIGKTTALVEYTRRHNHGETKYVRMPPGGSFDSFVRELADTMGLPTGSRTEDLRRRILDCFDSRMLLIVDECEECLSDRAGSPRGVNTLNFIREIHDKRRCGVVLAGANIFKRRLYHGHQATSMQRLVRRGMVPLQLPAVPPAADLAAFAAHFGLPPIAAERIAVRCKGYTHGGEETTETVNHSPLDLQTETVRLHGLGRWIMILTEASDLAREKKRAITWGAVIHAWHQFEQEAAFAEPAAQPGGGA